MRLSAIYRLLLVLLVVTLGPRYHVKALNVDLCCILTLGFSRCCKSGCGTSSNDKDEIIGPSSLTDVTWNLSFPSTTCIIKMKKKGTGSSGSSNSKSQPNSGTGQSQPQGTTPTTPGTPSTPSTPTNPTTPEAAKEGEGATPTTPNADGSTPADGSTATPTTPSTPSTPTTPSGTSSSKSSDKLQIVKNPYEHAFTLVFNDQVTYINVNWMGKDALKYEKADVFPLSISLKVFNEQALVQLKDNKYNAHKYVAKETYFNKIGNKPVIKYEIEDIKFLKDSSKGGDVNSTSKSSGTDSTSTKSQNEVDSSKIKLLKFPLALVYKLSEGSNCGEITCKTKSVWKYGDKNVNEYPLAVMFTLYREMCYIYFKDFYITCETDAGWQQKHRSEALKFEDKDIKFKCKEGMGTSDMGQDKFEKKEQEHEVEYLFKDGSNCTEVKWKDAVVWSISDLNAKSTSTNTANSGTTNTSTNRNNNNNAGGSSQARSQPNAAAANSSASSTSSQSRTSPGTATNLSSTQGARGSPTVASAPGAKANSGQGTPRSPATPTTPNNSTNPSTPGAGSTRTTPNPNPTRTGQGSPTTPSTPSSQTSPSTPTSAKTANKYPTKVYINRYTKVLVVEFNYLWYYCYRNEENKWERKYTQEDGKDKTPEEPCYFTGEEVDLKKEASKTKSGGGVTPAT